MPTIYEIWEQRYLQRFADFKLSFQNDINADIATLPDCTIADSLERWLEIYETAYTNFTLNLKKKDSRYRERETELGLVHGEAVIHPTKRKIEFIKGLLTEGANGIIELQPDTEKECTDKEQFLQNTIDEYLSKVRNTAFNTPADFNAAKALLANYFNGVQLKPQNKPVFIQNGNKKTLAKALYKIFRGQKQEKISIQFLQFIKAAFSCYADKDIDTVNINKSNLYKYLTAKS